MARSLAIGLVMESVPQRGLDEPLKATCMAINWRNGRHR